MALILGLIPLVLLGTTLALEPNVDGMGTHQQLGLPECTTVALLGFRCPACGMTTSWTLLTHGRPLMSVMTNAGGFLLAFVAVWFSVSAFFVGLSGHAPSYRQQWWFAFALIVVVVVTLSDWGYRLSVGL